MKSEVKRVVKQTNSNPFVCVGSDDIVGNFMDTVLGRMSVSDSWDDEAELQFLFQELCRQSSLGPAAKRMLENTRIRLQPSLKNTRAGRIGVACSNRLYNVQELQRLQISCQLEWPLNMFVDESHFEKYNELFVFLAQLMSAKHALHALFSANYQQSRASASVNIFWKKHKMELLRLELAHFTGVLHQSVVDFILGSEWERLCDTVDKAQTLEALHSAQDAFLFNSTQKCLVASDKLWALLSTRIKTMLNIVLQFCHLGQELIHTKDITSAFVNNCSLSFEKIKLEFEENRNFLLTVLNSKVRIGGTPQLVDFLLVSLFLASCSHHLASPAHLFPCALPCYFSLCRDWTSTSSTRASPSHACYILR